jgi:hypothetical protein
MTEWCLALGDMITCKTTARANPVGGLDTGPSARRI